MCCDTIVARNIPMFFQGRARNIDGTVGSLINVWFLSGMVPGGPTPMPAYVFDPPVGCVVVDFSDPSSANPGTVATKWDASANGLSACCTDRPQRLRIVVSGLPPLNNITYQGANETPEHMVNTRSSYDVVATGTSTPAGAWRYSFDSTADGYNTLNHLVFDVGIDRGAKTVSFVWITGDHNNTIATGSYSYTDCPFPAEGLGGPLSQGDLAADFSGATFTIYRLP